MYPLPLGPLSLPSSHPLRLSQSTKLSFLCYIAQPPPAAAAKSLKSCPTLCDPIDGSPPGSPVRGILQARTLEWVAISFSQDFLPYLPAAAAAKLHQSCPTLCDPIDGSPPGSPVPGIL